MNEYTTFRISISKEEQGGEEGKTLCTDLVVRRGEKKKKNGRNLEGKTRFRGARSNVPLLIDHDNNERRSEVTG